MIKLLKDICTLISAPFIILFGLGFALMIHCFIGFCGFYDRYIFPLPFRLYTWYYRYFVGLHHPHAEDIIARTIMRRINGHHDPEQGVFIFLTRYDLPSPDIMDSHLPLESLGRGIVQDVEEACQEQLKTRAEFTTRSHYPEYRKLA